MKHKRILSLILAAVLTLSFCPVVGAEGETETPVQPDICPGCGVALAELAYTTWDETTVFEENSLSGDNHYRLAADITLTTQVVLQEGGSLVLDLNGHTITAAATERCFLLYGAMTLLDSSEAKTGTLVGGNVGTRNGGTVCISTNGSFVMRSGTLRDGKAAMGGNLSCNSEGRFIYIDGGSIINGTAQSVKEKTGRGGNIYTLRNITITGDALIRDGYAQNIHDGSGRGGNLFIQGSGVEAILSGNAKIMGGYAASRAGNILVNSYASLTIRDNAEISGGSAKSYGNNLEIMTAHFNMEGGTIYGSPAGGCKSNIYTYSTSSTINITGGKIYGYFRALKGIPINISGDPYIEHLYLPTGALITPGQFEKTAWVGLEVQAEDQVFTGPLEDPSCYIYFFNYHKGGLTWYKRGGDQSLYLKPDGRNCQCCGEDVTDIAWLPLEDGTELLGNEADRVATHYRLESNVNLSAMLPVDGALKPITLDLNGFVLTTEPGKSAFSVKDNTTFNIVDNTDDKEGKIVSGGERAVTGGVIYMSGATKELNLYGGTISGGKVIGNDHFGGGVYLEYGTFNMYGGTISGNTSEDHAGNIFVSGGGTFNMYDGTISDGVAKGGGGNIYLTGPATYAYIYGGLITGGQTLTYAGGNIMVNSGANLVMYGGTVENGAAFKWAGNIYVGSSRTTNGVTKYSSMEMYGGTIGQEDDSLGSVYSLNRGSSSNGLKIYNGTLYNQTVSSYLSGCSCYATDEAGVTTVWNYGHGGDCDSFCPMEQAWGKCYVTELNQGSHEFKLSGGECSCSICKYTYYGEAAAVAGGKVYEDLQEALLNAPLNATVELLKDATLTETVVSEVTLDLNGHTLTTDMFTSAASGNVVDTSALSAGKLVCDNVTFGQTNASLPVTLEDGIHFIDIDFTQWLERVDNLTTKVKFYFTQRATETILDNLIRDGDTQVDVQIRLTWTDAAGKKQDKTFVFGNELLKKYAEKWNGRVFVTTIGAVNEITNLSCTYQVTSTAASGTAVHAATLKNVANINQKLTWDAINSYPLKRSDMTVEEMRELIVEFMEFTKTYLWTPDETVDYIRNAGGSKDSMKQGTIYGGLPYVGVASGNVYRMMDYIDPATGLLDMKKALPAVGTKERLSMSDLKYFGSQCSISVYWAWGRILNSMDYLWTYNTVSHNNFVLLGDMVIPDIDKWTADYNTTMACHENGEQLTYSNYAAAQKADALVYYIESSGGAGAGHLMMIYEDAHVVYNEDGTINGDESYLVIIDQGQSWKNKTNAAGDAFQHKGNIALKKTFKAMYDYGYVAYTFAEFLGEDPVEETDVALTYNGEALISGTIREKDRYYETTVTTQELTWSELMKAKITSNYGIADAYIILYDRNGAELYRHAVRTGTAGNKALSLAETGAQVTTWVNGTVFPGRAYTAKIEVQLATGERPVIWSGALVFDK